MTALAKAAQVLDTIVARIVIEMSSGQNDPGLTHAGRFREVGSPDRAAALIAPGAANRIVPASVGQNVDDCTVRPPAALTDPAGACEQHMSAELRPVDRTKPAHLHLDRHPAPARLCGSNGSVPR